MTTLMHSSPPFLPRAKASLAKLGSFLDVFNRIGFYCSALAVLLMMLPIVGDVIMRMAGGRSIPGVIEVSELCMLLVSFLALGYATQQGQMAVELVYDKLKPPVQAMLSLYATLICTVFAFLIAWYSAVVGLDKYHHFDVTPELFLSHWPFFMVVAWSAACMGLVLVRQSWGHMVTLVRNQWLPLLVLAVVLAGLTMGFPWLVRGTELAKSYSSLGYIAVLAMFVMLFGRVPIGFALGIIGILGMLVIMPNPTNALKILGLSPGSTSMSFIMTTIPMFVLMGEVVLHSRLSTDMFQAANVWLGRMPGGLAVSGVAGCAGFAAICGESLATALTMTSVALPEMEKHHYDSGLSCAALVAGGTLGILIPPSMGFILYAIVTDESISRLFMAGVIPGLILATLFSLIIVYKAIRHPELAPRGQHYSWMEKVRSLVGIGPIFLLVVFIMGGMLSGFFSPTEAGAVGAAGSIVYTALLRRLKFADFIASLKSTALLTTKIMLLLVGVHILGYFLSATRLPFLLSEWVMSLGSSPYVILAFVVLMYVILGCLMNVVPMLLLTLPTIFPSIIALGFDPIWFGVIIVILMEMGQITPPMGVIVFAVAGLPGTPPLMDIFKNIIPFVLGMLLLIVILTIFPQITLFLPNLLH